MSNPRIFPIADDALTIEFGQAIDLGCYEQVRRLEQALLARPFAGFLESIPAYASLSVFYDPEVVARAYPRFPTAQAAVVNYVEGLSHAPWTESVEAHREIEIPVCYDLRCASDLPLVAQRCGLSVAEVIAYHSTPTYRVFMLGFLPGFAYLGLVDERIAVPRHPTPRAQVPAGSVGIAGRQTGVYPTVSPGGWQLIGRTPVPMFDPQANPPARLQPGDEVRFVPITYEAWLDATTQTQ
ncbi:MAG: 5-oxoprolinase subunit PxpB [Chloracidobacterium sp.]|uniref:5-oxoprolinase subunit PxpB n=1 Tax=Chloracidobacterium validum TaxID=2821543 RepID=A0ABX8B5N9_9BACT|nr:5-oxoprolinase subunit PxpB [Chloracidobacterium validum]QUW02291.1 5-oxoprolinase subunit PxpB [Chloracidobacterium validum]